MDLLEVHKRLTAMLAARKYELGNKVIYLNAQNTAFFNQTINTIEDLAVSQGIDPRNLKDLNTVTAFYIKSQTNDRIVFSCTHIIKTDNPSTPCGLFNAAIEKIATAKRLIPNLHIDQFIIISSAKRSPQTNNGIISAYNYCDQVQFFLDQDLYPPDHILLPKIEPLSREAAGKIFQELRCRPVNLPKMYEGDPGIKYFGYTPGTILRITRSTMGMPTFVDTTISYSQVIKGDPPEPKIPKIK